MPNGGNESQNMQVAQSIAAAVAREFNASRDANATERLLRWLPLIIALATAFWTLAIQSKQVEENASDISKLELRYDQTQTYMQSVDSRLARIETTLEIVTGARAGSSNARISR